MSVGCGTAAFPEPGIFVYFIFDALNNTYIFHFQIIIVDNLAKYIRFEKLFLISYLQFIFQKATFAELRMIMMMWCGKV